MPQRLDIWGILVVVAERHGVAPGQQQRPLAGE
jgi:hypothetical protein